MDRFGNGALTREDGACQTCSKGTILRRELGTHKIRMMGFVIKRGVANGAVSNTVGAGMFNACSKPSIEMCVFRNNMATADGAGMHSGNTPVLLKNCLWERNITLQGHGAGLYVAGKVPLLIDASVFDNNQALGDTVKACGGAVYAEKLALKMVNCIVVGNSARYDGGAIFNNSGTLNLLNCTITQNRAGVFTGGHPLSAMWQRPSQIQFFGKTAAAIRLSGKTRH
jgi:hypothetical protein